MQMQNAECRCGEGMGRGIGRGRTYPSSSADRTRLSIIRDYYSGVDERRKKGVRSQLVFCLMVYA
jgi:hypothetical protein